MRAIQWLSVVEWLPTEQDKSNGQTNKREREREREREGGPIMGK